MRQPLILTPHHTTAELWDHYRHCRCAVEQRRTQAVALLSEGRSPGEIRTLTLLSRPTYAKTIHSYNKGGLAGLRDRRHENPGAPPLLTDAQLLLFVQTVRADYEDGILWDAVKLQAFVEDLLGEQIHARRSYELLELVGLSWQVPRPAHERADPKAQADFKKNASLKRLKRLGISPPA